MKKILFTFFTCMSFLDLFAQKQVDTIFYNEKWEKIMNADAASFYRVGIIQDSLLSVKDYYINGKLQMEGGYIIKDSLKHGDFKYFKDNGQLSSEGKYVKGNKEGKWISFHDNRQKSSDFNYLNDVMIGENTRYYEDGKLFAKELYLDDIEEVKTLMTQDTILLKSLLFFDDYKKLSLEERLKSINGLLNGKSYYYYKNGVVASEEQYIRGRFFSAQAFDEEGKKMRSRSNVDGTYIPPTFTNNNESFPNFIARNLVYPKKAIRNKIEGEVILGFTIDENGKMDKLEVISSPNEILNDAAIQVMLKSKNMWNPGYVHNMPIRISFKIPINFKLGK